MVDTLTAADASDLKRIVPELVGSGRFADERALAEALSRTPGRVLLTERGEIAVVDRWREHQPHLLIEGLWCEAARVPGMIAALEPIARERGLDRLLSAPVEPIESRPYERAGMVTLHRIRQMRRRVARPPQLQSERPVESAGADLFAQLMAVEDACFSDFWRFDGPQLRRVLQERRVTVVRSDDAIEGYAVTSLHASVGAVRRLAVIPGSQGMGIGRALLREAVAHLVGAGAREVFINTQTENDPAYRLYRSEGFRETPERLLILVSAKL